MGGTTTTSLHEYHYIFYDDEVYYYHYSCEEDDHSNPSPASMSDTENTSPSTFPLSLPFATTARAIFWYARWPHHFLPYRSFSNSGSFFFLTSTTSTTTRAWPTISTAPFFLLLRHPSTTPTRGPSRSSTLLARHHRSSSRDNDPCEASSLYHLRPTRRANPPERNGDEAEGEEAVLHRRESIAFCAAVLTRPASSASFFRIPMRYPTNEVSHRADYLINDAYANHHTDSDDDDHHHHADEEANMDSTSTSSSSFSIPSKPRDDDHHVAPYVSFDVVVFR